MTPSNSTMTSSNWPEAGPNALASMQARGSEASAGAHAREALRPALAVSPYQRSTEIGAGAEAESAW